MQRKIISLISTVPAGHVCGGIPPRPALQGALRLLRTRAACKRMQACLRVAQGTAITQFKDAGTYSGRGAKQDAEGSGIVDNLDPLAAENLASRSCILGDRTENILNVEEVTRDLAEYIRTPVELSKTCLLEWWWRNKQSFPALAALARQYLLIPAISLEVECYFFLRARRSATFGRGWASSLFSRLCSSS